MRVGFVGIGTMGRHMAANLQAGGHDLVVHDVRPEAAAEPVAAGATWAATPAEVAAASEVVFTSLPGPVEVEAVASGPHGLLEGAGDGTAWFDLSTNSPTVVPPDPGAPAVEAAYGAASSPALIAAGQPA